MAAFELQHWSEKHWTGFRDMHRHPEVMADLGGPIGDDESRQKFDRYRAGWDIHNISRWAVVRPEDGRFLGYAGVMRRVDADHPLGAHHEIGWRFCRDQWGKGLRPPAHAKLLRWRGRARMPRRFYPTRRSTTYDRRASCGASDCGATQAATLQQTIQQAAGQV
ncbi:RimJ/RimL family protein N-acetyltransferase [Sphingomonas endophytica]|uniref:RimJ/RimL family protein N-acetyltransferase n=1 Tax=Sphingomonas endophytica TaxID=869719 RepID=A0A7X0J9P5_9SPHN|nr:GNAT family N-acetyltransferase [Sphingomonas endophytica]MBB6503573.1 RimJ/RimL family protein N-acetyltransferase [Sphingomonas endophytica]